MMAEAQWVDRRHKLPSRISRDDGVNVWANSYRSTVPNTAGSGTAQGVELEGMILSVRWENNQFGNKLI
jgi:hypothetical protein